MHIQVTNRYNGKTYPAEVTLWAEHGWHAQIHDPSPNTWGRAPSGIGPGSVIDQGWQKDLERRGWDFPVFSGGPNIRDQEMKRLAATFQRPKEGLVDQLIPAPPVDEARPPYRRDPKHDPHLPHTTVLRNRDDLQIPSEAQAVIDQQWPEVVRTFEQYDKGAGMLMLYGCVRDACRAAKWPDNMAYLMRDYLIGKMNKAKVTTYTGSDDRRGDFQTFHMKPEESAQQLVNNLLERSQHEIGTELEKEHFSHGKPKDKTPGEVADTHLGENPRYYPTSKKPRGGKEALRWVKEHCGHYPADWSKQHLAKLRARRPDLTHRI